MQSVQHITPPHVRVLHKSDVLAVAEVNKVCVIYWRKQPNRATFAIQKHCLDSVVKEHRSGVGVICIVESSSDPPEEDLRSASSQMVISHGTNLDCVACVIEGAGFRAAITRAVLSSIVRVIRTPAPIKFFVTPSQAATWVATKMRVGSTAEFIRTVESVRGYLTD